jgi:hypothetical protein
MTEGIGKQDAEENLELREVREGRRNIKWPLPTPYQNAGRG